MNDKRLEWKEQVLQDYRSKLGCRDLSKKICWCKACKDISKLIQEVVANIKTQIV